MATLNTVILLAAVARSMGELIATCRKPRNGQAVKLPRFAATLIFVLSIILIFVLGASAFHLIWLFPFSAVIGATLLSFLCRPTTGYGLSWPVG
jgi:tryptophan-rich sensory protein